MKINLELLAISALAGFGVAYIFSNNTIFQYPTSARLMDIEPETPRDPREVEADTIDAQKEAAQYAYSRSQSYGKLSETQIARELQRNPIVGECAAHGWKTMTSYPGFIRRPDGLLQWDGRTVPDFAKGWFTDIVDCSRESGLDKAHCLSIEEDRRLMMEQLRNRPWYPGCDAREWAAKRKAEIEAHEAPRMAYTRAENAKYIAGCKARGDTECLADYGIIPRPSWATRTMSEAGRAAYELTNKITSEIVQDVKSAGSLVAMVSKPRVMITAEEELKAMQTAPDVAGMMKKQSSLRKSARQAERKPSPLSGEEAAQEAKSEAEKAARRARNEALTRNINEQQRAQKLAELQRWTNSSYVGVYLGDSGKGWYMGRRSL